jgi:plasmid maintenance system antidote protein VapI
MENRAQILKNWIEQEGRRQNWVAQQVGVSPQWLNYVLKGKKPLSDRLAHILREKLGVPLLPEYQALQHRR